MCNRLLLGLLAASSVRGWNSDFPFVYLPDLCEHPLVQQGGARGLVVAILSPLFCCGYTFSPAVSLQGQFVACCFVTGRYVTNRLVVGTLHRWSMKDDGGICQCTKMMQRNGRRVHVQTEINMKHKLELVIFILATLLCANFSTSMMSFSLSLVISSIWHICITFQQSFDSQIFLFLK